MALPIQYSPFAVILDNVVQRVAVSLGMSTGFVRPVASDDYKVTEVENVFAYLRIFKPSPIDATTGAYLSDGGAGRHGRTVARTIRVYLYTRSGVDEYGGDEIALMGAAPNQTVETPPTIPGQCIVEELALNALDDYVPLDSDGDAMTVGPLHWVDSGEPVRKPENEEGLVRSHLDFQAVYVLAVTNVEPAPTSLPAPYVN